jgi:hypothetical protein
MKMYKRVELYFHELTSALDGVEWSVSSIPHRKSPRYPLDRKLGGPRVSLDSVEKTKHISPARN